MPKAKRKPLKRRSHSKPRPTTKKFPSSSTAIVPVTPRPIIVQKNRERQLTGDEIELLKRTVCKGADNDEFALFLWTCKKHKLDPITRQIYAVFRNVTKHHQDDKGIWVSGKQMTIQMGIDGLRALAGRHHRDFGGCDEPVFVMSGTKTPAQREIPVSATVRLWKKGLEHPIVGSAYWDEFAPRDLTEAKADFYNRMPRHMLAKCAEALAIRKGYPDLSDIYTEEEMVQADQDYTPEGRIITDANGFTKSGRAVTYDAHRQIAKERQQEVLDDKLAHGHEPGSEKAKQAEATLKRVEEEDRKLAEERKQKAAAPPASITHDKPRGTIELDLTIANDVIIRGDIGDLLELIKNYCTATWSGDWWHIIPADVQTIHAMGQQLNYRVVEILPKVSPGTGRYVQQEQGEKGAVQGKASPGARTDSAPKSSAVRTPAEKKTTAAPAVSPSSEPQVVAGIIEQATPQAGKSPRLYVLLRMETSKTAVAMTAWDTKHFPFLIAGKGQQCELIVKRNTSKDGKAIFTNIIALRRIGVKEFDEDGKVILSVHREPGSLFQQ